MKKITPILIFTLLAVLLIAKPIFSQTDDKTLEKFNEHSGSGLNKEMLDKETGFNTVFVLHDVMVGSGEVGVGETDADGNPVGFRGNPGALSFASNLVGSIYASPPASGVYYAYDILHRFGAVPAYAQQGVGFTRLTPILGVWKAFRNVAYIFFTLVFIVVGLAIMFRVKISPQAVITIENALPKIVGALILVTFSYAIAGLLIDLMYVLISLGIVILQSGGVEPTFIKIGSFQITPTPENVIRSGFFGIIPMFFSDLGAGFNILGTLIGGMVGVLSGAGLGMLAGPLGALVGVPVGALAGGYVGLKVGPALVSLIWSIIALFLIFKLLFALLKAYIRILLSIIFAPLQIMAGAIPGSQAMGFGQWLKTMFADILIFPAVVMVAMIGVYIAQSFNVTDILLWTPPLIGLPVSIPGAHALLMKTFIGMGILLILPNVPDMIRNAMGIKDSGIGGMIGGALAPVRKIGGMGWSTTKGLAGSGIGSGYDLTKEKFARSGQYGFGRDSAGRAEAQGFGARIVDTLIKGRRR